MSQLQDTITQARNLLKKAELEKALLLVNQYLEANHAGSEATQESVSLLSRYNQLEKEQRSGVLDNADYSKSQNIIRLSFIGFLDALNKKGASDYTPTPDTPDTKNKKNIRLVIGIGTGVIVLGLISILLYTLFNRDNTEVVEPLGGSYCPDFTPDSKFNIAILPFLAFDDKPKGVHLGIQQRLGNLGRKHDMDIDARIIDTLLRSQDYPTDAVEATKLMSTCDAQLIIWGTEEQNANGVSTVIMNYKFLTTKNGLELSRLKVLEGRTIDTVRTVSSILSSGQITQGDLENAILLLLGIISHEMDHSSEAIAFLEQALVSDSSATLAKNMLLADNYLKKGNTAKSIIAYNNVVEEHPDYELARNNRGSLFYIKGQYPEAAHDLNKAVTLKKDTTTLLLSIDANLKANQISEARENLEAAKIVIPKNPELKAQAKEVKRTEDALKITREKVEQSLKQTPDDKEALRKVAVINQMLGDHQLAIRKFSDILEINPRDIDANASIVMEYLKLKDKEGTLRAIKKSIEQGITLPMLLKQRPELKPILMDMGIDEKTEIN